MEKAVFYNKIKDMASHDKEQPPKIFCLFHQKIDCTCIAVVTTEKALIERLEHHIRLNNILIKHRSDPEQREEIAKATEGFQKRLDGLRNS